MTHLFDWQGVLSGQPLQWIISGFLTTLWVTLAGIVLASLLAILFLALRLAGGRVGRGFTAAWVSLFRNTPLLVQLLFWYFAAWNLLPQGVREFVNDDHGWSILPGDVWWLTPEFLCSAWGLGVFTSAFLIEEAASGLHSVSNGQREAALALGVSNPSVMLDIVMPQALKSTLPGLVNEMINLLKNTSLVSCISLVDLLRAAQMIISKSYRAFEPLLTVAIIYYILVGILAIISRRVERWVNISDRR